MSSVIGTLAIRAAPTSNDLSASAAVGPKEAESGVLAGWWRLSGTPAKTPRSTTDYLDSFSGNSYGAASRYRSSLGVTWTGSQVDASLGMDYAPGVDETLDTGDELLELSSDDWTTVDFQLGYNFPANGGLAQGLKLYLGVENLFDEGLPFMATSPDGWDRNLGDLRGRYIYAGLRKRF